MKKSLLTVALAALATTAFANIDLYKTNDVTLSAYGSLEAKLALNNKHDQSQQNLSKESEAASYSSNFLTETKTGFRNPSYKAKFGLFANYKNADGFLVGLNGRVSFGASKVKEHKHTYTYSDKKVADEATYGYKKDKESLKPVLHLDKAYLTLGHPQFGYLSVGKMSTVADDFAGTTSDIVEDVTVKGTTSADFVVKYKLPTFTDNLDLSYSFTNNFEEKTEKNGVVYSRSHAALLTYSDNGLTFGSGFVLENLYGRNATFNNFDVTKRTKSSQTYLEVASMPYVEDLSALVSYTFSKDTYYNAQQQTKKDYSQVALVEVKYNCFDVVTPYVGYAFTHNRTHNLVDEFDGKKVSDFKIADKNQVYLGLASSYKFDGYAKVQGFAEVAWAKENSRTVDLVESAKKEVTVNATPRTRTYQRDLKVGVKVSF